jgi:phospholipase D1/2
VYGRAPHGAMDVQVVRSVSDWSHGVLMEKSVQTACELRCFFFFAKWEVCNYTRLDCQLIAEAQHFIYIGTLRFFSGRPWWNY